MHFLASDIMASYAGIALGMSILYVFIKWVKLRHIYFTMLYLAGTALSSVGGLFLAWPLTHHIILPMLIAALCWSGLCLRLFVQHKSQTATLSLRG